MDSNKNLEAAVVHALGSSGMGAVAAEYSELGFDSLLSENALRDLPFVNTIIAVGKIGLGINDILFTKKLLRFLSEIKDLSNEERHSMIEKLDQEEGFRQRVGERIIEILDRIDSHKKPEMVARAFRAFAQSKIDYDKFCSLTYAIQMLPLHAIKVVKNFQKKSLGSNHFVLSKPDQSEFQIYNAFAIAGLAVMHPALDGALQYGPTALCSTFVSIVLSGDSSH